MFQYILLDPHYIAGRLFLRRLANIVLASAAVFGVVGAAALAIRVVLL